MEWRAWGVERGAGASREALVLVTAGVESTAPRGPVLLNLVLDRSGSMKGAPLSAAVEAAAQLVDLATDDDFVGLVLFDGLAEQRVPVSRMDARGKRTLTDALRDVQVGRGTALHQALTLGLTGLQRTFVPGRRPQLLVLTDGEPSVGPDTLQAFEDLGRDLAAAGVSVHALGLARHYLVEVLEAITRTSGNAFEHVDGPEGLPVAMGGLCARLFGNAAGEVSLRVQPEGLLAVSCRHGYPTAVEGGALVVRLGDVSLGFVRRVLLVGTVGEATDWSLGLSGTSVERGDGRQQRVDVARVAADSDEGRLVVAVGEELELVTSETGAWLSLARRDIERAEQQLEDAEARLKAMNGLGASQMPLHRHRQRLADLRMAIERGEGDIPLLVRRAQSARSGTHVSQVIPVPPPRPRR